MEIYILRHGIAVERGTKGYKNDGDRPLTKDGEDKTKQIAKALRALDLKFDLVLSSPYVRARQTAEIVAEVLDQEVTLTDFLIPDASAVDLIGEINAEKPQRVLLVGHEPDLSRLVSVLITGGPGAGIELKKGGICKLTSEKLTFGQCATLNWLMIPKHMRNMA
jgi:phosphohistidine phosphatase